MTSRWQLLSLLRGQVLDEIFRGTPWTDEAALVDERGASAIEQQDRVFLDHEVPNEMAVFGLAVLGTIVYRQGGWLRVNPDHGGTPVPLCWVLHRYGGTLTEELLEFAMVREPN